jgi:hypothetical protein
MKKVIHFLILGLAILHFTDAEASSEVGSKISVNLKSLVQLDMSLTEFVDEAQKSLDTDKMDIGMKVALIKTFNQYDRNGDLEIDRYEYLTMN